MCMSLARIELVLEKKLFFDFLGADFVAPKSDHRRDKQPVLALHLDISKDSQEKLQSL